MISNEFRLTFAPHPDSEQNFACSVLSGVPPMPVPSVLQNGPRGLLQLPGYSWSLGKNVSLNLVRRKSGLAVPVIPFNFKKRDYEKSIYISRKKSRL